MSDYKVVESEVNMNNKQRLVSCLEAVLGAQVELNSSVSNRWGHPTRVDIAIRQDQLPDHVRGFGDIGLKLSNGKFNWVTVTEHDAQLIDRTGALFANINVWQQEVENAYAATTFFEEQASSIIPAGVRLGTPKAINDPTGEVNNAWGIPFEVDAETLRRMGVQVPL